MLVENSAACRNDFGATGRFAVDFYEHLLAKSDLHFFLGTVFNYSMRASNPWVIIGSFPLTETAIQ